MRNKLPLHRRYASIKTIVTVHNNVCNKDEADLLVFLEVVDDPLFEEVKVSVHQLTAHSHVRIPACVHS